MFKAFIKNLPNRYFWLANLIFWLILNTLATDNSYRQQILRQQDVDWLNLWINYLPWWTLWALVAPLIIAATKLVSFNENHPINFVLKNILMACIFLAIYWGLTILISVCVEIGTINIESLSTIVHWWKLSLLHVDFLVYLGIVCVGYSVHYYSQSKQQKLRNEELAHQLVKVELQSLKSQLNPHFLFNTLNTVASLVRLDNKQGAVNALSELSQMLRTVLEHQSEQIITLKQEIDFINSYLAIQKIRFEEKLIIKVSINPKCLDAEIPFMIIQTLVENAVQHGSQLSSNNNILELDINCKNDTLTIKLINKIPEHDEHDGFGIGLKNAKQRLEKLYSGNFKLHLTSLDNGYFETKLSLPCGIIND